MKTRSMVAALVLIAAITATACHGQAVTTPQANSAQSNSSGELRFKVPEGWVTEKASSSMRVAQYKLPKTEGDKDDGSLVLYYFGSNQGGSAQANIDRWIGQMQQPDGSSSKDKAKTESVTINGLRVTTVDVTGVYTAEMAPGSGSFHNDDNYRLRAAVVETPKGNYYVKLAGPAKTIAKWDQGYNDYLKSFEFK